VAIKASRKALSLAFSSHRSHAYTKSRTLSCYIITSLSFYCHDLLVPQLYDVNILAFCSIHPGTTYAHAYSAATVAGWSGRDSWAHKSTHRQRLHIPGTLSDFMTLWITIQHNYYIYQSPLPHSLNTPNTCCQCTSCCGVSYG